jgi:hypothetical protein
MKTLHKNQCSYQNFIGLSDRHNSNLKDIDREKSEEEREEDCNNICVKRTDNDKGNKDENSRKDIDGSSNRSKDVDKNSREGIC